MIVEKAYAPSRFGQLHYRIVRPDGPVTQPPLLVLHQTPSNSYEWMPILPLLAQDRVVIAPDTPGYGMSDAPDVPASIADFAGVMADLLDHLAARGEIGGGAFDVMGAHTGSIIATELAVSLPERVRRLVLFGLAAYPEHEREKRLALLLEKFPRPGGDLAHVEQLWAIFGELGDARMTSEQRHVAMAECLRLGVRMPWGYIGVYRYDFLGALARVEQDALVVNAQDDLWDVTHEVAPVLRHGRLWPLPGRAHGFLAFDAAEIAPEILGFLNG
jgi:pimeloyl-ACP methyl ester carboxylesterase